MKSIYISSPADRSVIVVEERIKDAVLGAFVFCLRGTQVIMFCLIGSEHLHSKCGEKYVSFTSFALLVYKQNSGVSAFIFPLLRLSLLLLTLLPIHFYAHIFVLSTLVSSVWPISLPVLVIVFICSLFLLLPFLSSHSFVVIVFVFPSSFLSKLDCTSPKRYESKSFFIALLVLVHFYIFGWSREENRLLWLKYKSSL